MDLKPSIEAAAKAICKSGKFECGQGCCAPICMENLGTARDKCTKCVQVHGKLAEAIVNALPRASGGLEVAMVERVARAICTSQGDDPDGTDILKICGPANEPLPLWMFYAEQAEAALRTLPDSGEVESHVHSLKRIRHAIEMWKRGHNDAGGLIGEVEQITRQAFAGTKP